MEDEEDEDVEEEVEASGYAFSRLLDLEGPAATAADTDEASCESAASDALTARRGPSAEDEAVAVAVTDVAVPVAPVVVVVVGVEALDRGFRPVNEFWCARICCSRGRLAPAAAAAAAAATTSGNCCCC